MGKDGEMPVVGGLLAAARFFFGNDTGALHLAAALGRPVVPIFGGGHWPRFAPVARRSLTVVQPLPCFGCGWDCHFVDAPCVRTISTASVQRALRAFLREDTDGQIVVEAEGLSAGARALIDTATPRLRFVREDSTNRLRQVENLTGLLRASEADRGARQEQITALTAWLKESEADRLARGKQIEELTAWLLESRADGASQGQKIAELTAELHTREAARTATDAPGSPADDGLQTSEADRDGLEEAGEETNLPGGTNEDPDLPDTIIQTGPLMTDEQNRCTGTLTPPVSGTSPPLAPGSEPRRTEAGKQP